MYTARVPSDTCWIENREAAYPAPSPPGNTGMSSVHPFFAPSRSVISTFVSLLDERYCHPPSRNRSTVHPTETIKQSGFLCALSECAEVRITATQQVINVRG